MPENQKLIQQQLSDPDIIYSPEERELQLTFRAIATGCFIGGIITMMNVYFGLKTGWGFGGSIISATLGFAFFKLISPKKPYTISENNITQTTGSAAGSMTSAAGLSACIPALQMLHKDGEINFEINYLMLTIWAIAIAYIGVMFAIPLRKQYVLKDKLRFPSGFATAHTIKSFHDSAEKALKQTRYILLFGGLAFMLVILGYFIPWFDSIDFATLFSPPIDGIKDLTQQSIGANLSAWGIGTLLISPFLIGLGMMSSPKLGYSVLIGAISGWLLGYLAQQQGWTLPASHSPMEFHNKEVNDWGVRGWILWTGVAIMVSDSITSLCIQLVKTYLKPKIKTTKTVKSISNDVPTRWWVTGLILASILACLIGFFVFELALHLILLSLILSFLLAIVAVRVTGETDITPIGGMGKVTQLFFGMFTTSATVNLLSAGITGAGASQASDMMQDLKTGHMLGSSPKKQFKAQLIGVAAGIVFAIPAYMLVTKAYYLFETPPDDFKNTLAAPAAQAWKAVALVLKNGLNALPNHVSPFILMGLGLGVLFPLLKTLFPKWDNYLPSGTAFGLAFLLSFPDSLAIFTGTIIMIIWKKRGPKTFKELIFAVASGLVVGDGLAGLVKALILLVS